MDNDKIFVPPSFEEEKEEKKKQKVLSKSDNNSNTSSVFDNIFVPSSFGENTKEKVEDNEQPDENMQNMQDVDIEEKIGEVDKKEKKLKEKHKKEKHRKKDIYKESITNQIEENDSSIQESGGDDVKNEKTEDGYVWGRKKYKVKKETKNTVINWVGLVMSVAFVVLFLYLLIR